MKARTIMASNPEVLVPGDSVSHAASVMKKMVIGALPVVEDRTSMRLVGIVALADRRRRPRTTRSGSSACTRSRTS